MELRAVTENIKLILLGAFLCAIGGVLLWINGGSTWYFLRHTHSCTTLELTGIFTAWLFIYGLVGVMLTLIWMTGQYRLCGLRSSLLSFALMSGVYLLMLVWYALFFCTRLFLFSVVILCLSVILCALSFVFLKKTMLLVWFVGVVIETLQMYFIYFSFAIYAN